MPKEKSRLGRLHLATWGSLCVVIAGLYWCERLPRSGQPNPDSVSIDHSELWSFGWPLITYAEEWDWRTNGLSIMRPVSSRLYPDSWVVNAIVCVAIVLATGIVVERWLRSPNRLAFRLSTLLKATALIACLITYASAEDDLAFRVVYYMNSRLNYDPMPYQTVPAFRATLKVIALAGLGCVLSVAFSLVCGLISRLAVRGRRAVRRLS